MLCITEIEQDIQVSQNIVLYLQIIHVGGGIHSFAEAAAPIQFRQSGWIVSVYHVRQKAVPNDQCQCENVQNFLFRRDRVSFGRYHVVHSDTNMHVKRRHNRMMS